MRSSDRRGITLLPLLFLSLWACEPDPLGIDDGADPPAQQPTTVNLELTFDPFHPSLDAGSTIQLTACWKTPDGGAGWPIGAPYEITWTSEDPEIAVVTEEGEVEGIAPGMTVIHATATRTYTAGVWIWTWTRSGSTPVGVR